MTLHVISDLRNDLQVFKGRLLAGDISPEQARRWFDRLDRRVDDVEAYLDDGGPTERLVLTDVRRSPGWLTRWTKPQPGRRTPYTRHLAVVDGGAA